MSGNPVVNDSVFGLVKLLKEQFPSASCDFSDLELKLQYLIDDMLVDKPGRDEGGQSSASVSNNHKQEHKKRSE
jgi:hypothetical protein